MKDDIEKYGSQYEIERRKQLQRILFQLYEEDLKTGKNKDKKPHNQTDLGKIMNVDQSAISNLLKHYKIDWSDRYTIKLKSENNESSKKTDELPIEELTKNITITKPSTFFISVGLGKRNQLENFLQKHFRSSKDKPGILHIINIKNPSGLLIFSDDHNLEYTLHNNDYLKQLTNNVTSTKSKEDIVE